jgi:hypothetical protein
MDAQAFPAREACSSRSLAVFQEVISHQVGRQPPRSYETGEVFQSRAAIFKTPESDLSCFSAAELVRENSGSRHP